MKAESEYIHKLWELYPQDTETSLETIKLADEAVKAFPNSPEFWVLCGCLIQLADADCPYNLEDALKSFKKAVNINPSFDAAWKEIGHFYDAVEPNRKLSLEAFKTARDLKRINLK